MLNHPSHKALTFAEVRSNIRSLHSNNKGKGKFEMAATLIGILITATAIEAGKFTQYQCFDLPWIALAGVLTVIASLIA